MADIIIQLTLHVLCNYSAILENGVVLLSVYEIGYWKNAQIVHSCNHVCWYCRPSALEFATRMR